MAAQDVAIALEEAQLEILGKITDSAGTLGASHRVLQLANAYALLQGTTKTMSAYEDPEMQSV